MAQVVAPDSADRWRELLETRLGAPGLGDYAFQIDRSAAPAMTSDKGATPSDVRVSFLVEVLQLLRQSARVLLLHGFGGRDRWQEWWRQDQRLIAAFLEMDPSGVALDWRYVAGRNSLGTIARDGRKVIYSRALSNRVTPGSADDDAAWHEILETYLVSLGVAVIPIWVAAAVAVGLTLRRSISLDIHVDVNVDDLVGRKETILDTSAATI